MTNTPTTLDALRAAALRMPGRADMTPAQLAQAIQQPAALAPMTLHELLMACVARGLNPEAVRPVWAYSEFVNRLSAALSAGRLDDVQGLLMTAPADVAAAAAVAMQVVQSRTLRLIDVVAGEYRVAAPATVTATDIEAALAP